jgi:Type II restriction endonuclease, TdeIII
MTSRDAIKKIIKKTIIKSITDFANKSLTKKAKFQVLDLLIPKERKIRSIVGGLETSLGTTLWEPLAKSLASKNGFTVVQDKLLKPCNMPSALGNTLQTIIDDRATIGGIYNASKSHEEIKKICQKFKSKPITELEAPPKGFGIDIWLKKNNINYFFDTKTVQPNIGAYSKFVEQILNWYAFFYSQFPNEEAQGRIVFPYNPDAPNDFWEKTTNKGFPLEKNEEAWVGNEFWDFCSGHFKTYELIETAFLEIRDSKKLEKKFDNLFKD